MIPEVDQIMARIPRLASVENLQVERLAGLTNTNYRLTANGERFVLRISGSNAERLGINREFEREALLAASKAGIAPEVVDFVLPEGHLLAGYIDGRHLKIEEYRSQENLGRIVKTVKRLHALQPVRAAFSAFRRVEKFASQARSMGVPFPKDFDKMVQKMAEIEREQVQDSSPWHRFCHNDLFCVNVLDDGDIWFIDWEFAGMGDIYFDLATLTVAYDSPDTLPPELQDYVLVCYFGEATAENQVRLQGMRYMVMFFSAMWSFLQQGLQNAGLVKPVEGFDFMAYAETTFEFMRSCLQG